MKVTLVKFVLKLLLQFLKQRNGFIIHSNKYVNVYWISLGTELYFCSITVTKKKKIFYLHLSGATIYKVLYTMEDKAKKGKTTNSEHSTYYRDKNSKGRRKQDTFKCDFEVQ